MPLLNLMTWLRNRQARLSTGKDAWAIRHLNPDSENKRLERLGLESPAAPWLSWKSQDKQRYSDPSRFCEQAARGNVKTGAKPLSAEQAERLKNIHKTLALSERLTFASHRENGFIDLGGIALTLVGVAGTFLVPPLGLAAIGVGGTILALRLREEAQRQALKKEIGQRILQLKPNETTALSLLTRVGSKKGHHAVGVSVKKLPASPGICRLEMEHFGGWSDRSQRKIISFPESALKQQKGLNALEDFVTSGTHDNPDDAFTLKLNRFLKSVNGSVEKTLDSDLQKIQKMGNCWVHNPQQAMFRAIANDPALGNRISRDFQRFLARQAINIIEQSPAFRPGEKRALADIQITENLQSPLPKKPRILGPNSPPMQVVERKKVRFADPPQVEPSPQKFELEPFPIRNGWATLNADALLQKAHHIADMKFRKSTREEVIVGSFEGKEVLRAANNKVSLQENVLDEKDPHRSEKILLKALQTLQSQREPGQLTQVRIQNPKLAQAALEVLQKHPDLKLSIVNLPPKGILKHTAHGARPTPRLSALQR